jgi:hypothetical protein
MVLVFMMLYWRANEIQTIIITVLEMKSAKHGLYRMKRKLFCIKHNAVQRELLYYAELAKCSASYLA